MIDSYEGQINGVDANGASEGVFSRRGEGSGEFGSPACLALGEDRTVGVVEMDLRRFTIFEASGA